MSEIFSINPDLFGLRVYGDSHDAVNFRVGTPMAANTAVLTKEEARSLASALLQWAGSDDLEWGPLIPWHGGECPLDEWELDNARLVFADDRDNEYGRLYSASSATSSEWSRGESDWHVIAYRVRKRPPAPVEEWVPLTVVLGLHDVDIEILTRDGKAVDARMAQEGE